MCMDFFYFYKSVFLCYVMQILVKLLTLKFLF